MSAFVSPYRMSGEERYRSDPAFAQLVDLMEHFIHRSEYTPSEMREASVLASIHFEMRTLRRFTIPADDETLAKVREGKARLDELEREMMKERP